MANSPYTFSVGSDVVRYSPFSPKTKMLKDEPKKEEEEVFSVGDAASGAVSGGLSGAAYGATTAGMVVPGLGHVAGGVVGGVLGALGGGTVGGFAGAKTAGAGAKGLDAMTKARKAAAAAKLATAVKP
tara:strand:+ start:91 stop:474 length:384 start_codon:yes stop_codon:yes gene_type:complete